jgi:methionyl aminopeptidase
MLFVPGALSTMDILQSGDIVNFDITLEKNGYIADSSKTYPVGEVSPLAKRLVQVTYEATVGRAVERRVRSTADC